MNKSEIYTDENKESLNISTAPDLQRISNLLHESGLTPYIFVRHGLLSLINGKFPEARRHIDYARKFHGIFYEPGSPEDREYLVEMQLLNAAFIFLTDKFRKLPLVKGMPDIKGDI